MESYSSGGIAEGLLQPSYPSYSYQLLSPGYQNSDDHGYAYTQEYRPQTNWLHDDIYSNHHSNPTIKSTPHRYTYDHLPLKNNSYGIGARIGYEDYSHTPEYGHRELSRYQELNPPHCVQPVPWPYQTSASYLCVPQQQVATTGNGYLAVPSVGHCCRSPLSVDRRYSKGSMFSYRSSQRSISAISNVSANSEMCMRGVYTVRRPSYDWCE